MSRFVFPKLALVATVTTVGVACGDVDNGIDLGAPATARQAVITTFAPQISRAGVPVSAINEGDTITVTSSLCVDTAADVTVQVTDWTDGVAPVAGDTILRAVADFAPNTLTCPDPDGAGPLLNFEVCGPATSPCTITHTYADDNGGTTVNVNVRATQGGSEFNQGLGLARFNLPPTIQQVNRVGGINEGQIHNITVLNVNDPGTRANEIASVVITIEPAGALANAFPSTPITCSCQPSGFVCDNGVTTGACRGDLPVQSRWLDNGDFTVRATVTDKETPALTDTETTVALAVANVPPTLGLSITNADTDPGDTSNLTDFGSGTVVNPLAVTTVVEGFNYRFNFAFNDVGTDALDWDWDFANGQQIASERSSPAARLTGSVGRPAQIGDPLTLTAPAADLVDNFAWDQAFLPNAAIFVDVGDDDNGDSDATHQINVIDVDPIQTAVADSAVINTVDEGTQVVFTVSTRSGDFASGFDPISTTGYAWEVSIDGTFSSITNLAVGAIVSVAGRERVRIDAGCDNVGTGGATGENTCTVTFLDGGPEFANNTYAILATVRDEDSFAQATSETITVNNVAPTITNFVVSQGGTPVVQATGILENTTVSVDVSVDDESGVRDGLYTLAVAYGDTDNNTDTATVSLGAFATQSRLIVDNKRCNGPGSSATVGLCTITVTVCEAAAPAGDVNACDSDSFVLRVNNVAPTADAIAPASPTLLVEGTAFTFDGEFNDPGAENDQNYAVTWTWNDGVAPGIVTPRSTSVPGGSTFADRLTSPDLAGIDFVNVPSAGLSNVSLQLAVTDIDTQTDTDTITVNVRDNRPTIRIVSADLLNANDLNTADVRENASTGRVVLTVAPETTADLLTTITVNWGDGTISTLTGVAAAPGAGQFLNTGDTVTVIKPGRYADNCDSARNVSHTCAAGRFVVTATVSDEDSTDRFDPISQANQARVVCSGGQPFVAACQETSLDVQNQNPIVFASNPAVASTIVVAEGQAATIVITADDIAGADIIGAGGNLMEFEFNWGDGTTDVLTGTQTAGGQDFGPPGNIQDNFTRVGRGAHIYSSPGQFNVVVTITDKDGGVVAAAYTVDVINVAPVLTDLFATLPTFEGIELSSLAVVENRGADTLDYTFSTSNDDCNPDNGLSDADFPVARPAFNLVTPDPTDLLRAQQTSGVFKTTFPDNATETICVRVCDDDVQLNSCVFGSVDVVVRNVDPVITAFTAAGLAVEGGAITFTTTATDVPADALTTTIDCGNGTAAAAGVCQYPSSGAFTAAVTVTDGDGGSAIKTAQVAIANLAPAAPSIVVGAGTDLDVAQGETARVTLTATDPGADPIQFVFENGFISQTIASGGQATQSLPFTTTTTVNVRACDIEGACSAPANVVVNVTNAPPVITNLTVPSLVRQGTTFSVAATATDPGNDALEFEFEFTALDNLPPAGANTGLRDFDANNTVQGVRIDEAGRIRVDVTARDIPTGATATASAFIDVENVPGRLVSFTANDSTVDEGTTVLLDAVASDPFNGGTTFTFAFDCGNGTAGVITGSDALSADANCVYGDNGNFVATVTSTDNNNNVDTRSVVIAVANLAPVDVTLTPSATTVVEGNPLTFTATAGDVAADLPLTFEFDLNGDGVIDNRNTTGLSSFTYGDNASVNATVRACDKDGGCTAAAPVAVNVVNVAPVIAANGIIFPASIPVGSPFTATVQATDVAADTLSFTFNFSGANTLANVNTGTTPSTTQVFANAGTTTFTVTVTDKDGGSVTSDPQSFTIENEAPRLLTFTQTPISFNEGASTALVATASDRGGGALTFTFDCGANGTLSAGLTPETASCAFAQSGTNLVTVTVRDAGTLSDTRTATVVVNNVAPVIETITVPDSANQGAVATFNVSASDVLGDTVRIEYDFNNDGIFDTVGASGVNVTTTFTRAGVTTYTFRACDNEGACSDRETRTITIDNVRPVVAVADVANTIVGAPVTVQATGTDAGNDALTFTFTFTRGVTAAGSFTQASPVLVTSFNESGSYQVSVTASDGTIDSLPVTDDFVVANINTDLNVSATPSTLFEGGSTRIDITSANGVGPFELELDANGDGTIADTERFNCLAAAAIGDCFRNITFSNNRSGDQPFRLNLSVNDIGSSGTVNTTIVTVDVANVAPTISAGGNVTIAEGANFSRTLTATDPGADIQTFELVSGPPGLTVSSAGAVAWTPAFTDAAAALGKENIVRVRVTDSDNASDPALSEASFTINVTIIDTNDNGVSDTQELALNNGELLDARAGETDADNDGVSDLDEVLAGTSPNVSDAPRAPTPISPNGVTVNTATPVLTVANAFSPRGRTLTYTFVIEDDTGEVGRIENVASGETTTSVTVPTTLVLEEETNYTWFAFAEDGLRNLAGTADIQGVNSTDATFLVNAVNAAPGAPNALSPANTASFLDGTIVTLEARASVDPDGDALTYTFELAREAAFATIIQTSPARDVPVFTIPEPLAVGTYHWRARANDGALNSAFGTPGTFAIEAIEINQAPSAPGISAPTNVTLDAATATLTITASIDPNGDALQYEFEHATNAAFAGATASGRQAGLTFAVSSLAEDTQHFWRARAFDGELYSDWSNATFVVDAENGAPSGLALLSPTNGSLLLAAPTAFTATEAEDPEGDALTYTVVVSAAEDFSAPLVNASATVANGVVTLAAPATLSTDLELGETYFWRVTASDGTNDIVASASFTLFLPEDDGASVGGGGCQCSSTDNNGAVGVLGAAAGLLALRRRRRR